MNTKLKEYISKKVRKVLKENLDVDYKHDIERINRIPSDISAYSSKLPYFKELVYISLNSSPYNIKRIRTDDLSSEIYEMFLKLYPTLLNPRFISYDHIEINPTLIKNIIRKYPEVVKDLPYHLRTDENYKLAILKSPLVLRYIPIQFRNYKLCKLAVSKYAGAFYDVPIPEKITKKVYKQILDFYEKEYEIKIGNILSIRQYINILKIVYQKDKNILYYSPISNELISKIENNTI